MTEKWKHSPSLINTAAGPKLKKPRGKKKTKKKGGGGGFWRLQQDQLPVSGPRVDSDTVLWHRSPRVSHCFLSVPSLL